ncbi:shTK domain protein, partial [Ancylostoma ceylanicum]
LLPQIWPDISEHNLVEFQIGTDTATTTVTTTTTKAAVFLDLLPDLENSSPISACVDLVNPKTGKSDCPKVAYLCSDAKYYMVMHVQCPKTCGRCDANGGTIAPVIPPTGRLYMERIRQKIQKNMSTPQYCVAGCQDMVDYKTGLSNCANMASYCHNALYKDVMKQQCPKTCGYCQ